MVAQFLSLFSRKEKRTLILLIFLLLCLTLSEFVSLGLIMPFLSVVMDPGIIKTHPKLKLLYKMVSANSEEQFQVILGSLLIGLFVLKTIFALYADRKRINLSKTIEHNLMCRLLRSNLLNSYPFFLKYPPSALYHNLVGETPQVAAFLANFLVFFSEVTVVFSIVILFGIVSPWITFCLVVGMGLICYLNYYLIKNKVKKNAQQREKYGLKRGRSSLQNYNGMKDIKIFNNEFFFLKNFKEYNSNFLKTEARLMCIQQFQFRFFECMALTAILSVLMILVVGATPKEVYLPILAIFVVGFFKILPSVIKILNSVTIMKHSSIIVEQVFKLFTEPPINNDLLLQELNENDLFVNKKEKMLFHSKISIDIKTFQYESRMVNVLENFSIEFEKNKTFGLVGTSGSGKTTVIDILLGLNELSDGFIIIDEKRIGKKHMAQLRNCIGYVPQRVFLYDTSILNNIAFGDEEVDEERVKEVIEISQLTEFVDSLPDGLRTVVGEFGVNISGGQLQRVGIARALYLDPEILILDEATGSLDNNTEKEFMNSINPLQGKKTIIISAHRINTIKNCDEVFYLSGGKIVEHGTFKELYRNNLEFKNLVEI